VTLVPRTCAVRQAREAWGQQPSALPLLVEKPGRTKDEAPRRWQGQRVMRLVEVESRAGRGAQEAGRVVGVHSSQLAQQQAPSYAVAQAQAAEAVADHGKHVPARWCACRPAAEAAIAEDEHRGQGQRGRRPRLWRYHAVRSRRIADTRRTRRARRGRPAKTAPPPTAPGYRLVVAVAALSTPEADTGWTLLATTVWAEACGDAEILPASQEPHTTGDPGFRWIKTPAAISPVWREKPARIAALAMLTGVGLRVDTVIQRQVRLDLLTPEQQLPGNQGETATPTAAVVFTLCSPVALVQ
jgi:hypothetical protein